jgi:hypothetical protein
VDAEDAVANKTMETIETETMETIETEETGKDVKEEAEASEGAAVKEEIQEEEEVEVKLENEEEEVVIPPEDANLTPKERDCKKVVNQIRKEEFGIGIKLNEDAEKLMRVQQERLGRSLDRYVADI